MEMVDEKEHPERSEKAEAIWRSFVEASYNYKGEQHADHQEAQTGALTDRLLENHDPETDTALKEHIRYQKLKDGNPKDEDIKDKDIAKLVKEIYEDKAIMWPSDTPHACIILVYEPYPNHLKIIAKL